MFLRISSRSFGDGEGIPEKHAHDHANLSPPLTWRGAPREIQSLALVVEDEDAPHGGSPSYDSRPVPGRGGIHRCRFGLTELAVPYLTIEPAERAEVVRRTARDHVLKQAEPVGTYER